jgi:dsRNA-specific ribonuclease
MHVQHPDEPLLAAATLPSLAKCNPLLHKEISKCEDEQVAYLLPEFARVLPIPLSMLYVAGICEAILPELERSICVSMQASVLWTSSVGNLVPETDRDGSWHRTTSLPGMLEAATTLFPTPTYERLEFLGDAVLGFFVAINSMAKNSPLEWDCFDIGEILSRATRNSELASAATRSRLQSILYNQKRRFESAYQLSNNGCSASKEKKQRPPIAKSTLSDCTESLLGAAYCADIASAPAGGKLVLSILESLRLPFPAGATSTNYKWFVAVNPCLRQPYDFDQDCGWAEQLHRIRSILSNERSVNTTLDQGFEHILSILTTDSDIIMKLSQKIPSLLIRCALFDDSLDDKKSFQDGDTLEFVALLRDTLYVVGAYGLQLSITEEVFRRNPRSPPGDLHLLRACAMTDDVVSYVLIRHGWHQMLFDQETPCIPEFSAKMKAADYKGMKLWQQHNGWILPGGIEEFRRRCKCFGVYTEGTEPQYPGLAGGRLCGNRKKQEESLTEELMVSFKAIMGALILSLGLETTWKFVVGKLFNELLLLTPEEMRLLYSEDSTLVKSSGQGQQSAVI